MPPITRALALLGVGASLLSGAGQARATVADDLCPAISDPCIISAVVDIDDGSLLDFGSRAVIVTTGTLQVGEGTMTILAGSFTIDPGGIVRGRGDIGGQILITTSGDIVINGTSAGGAINLRGAFEGGVLEMTSTAGSILGSGRINISSGETGGSATFDALVEIDLTGQVDGQGSSEDFAGALLVDSGGPVHLAEVNLSGGEAGELMVTAGGAVTIGTLTARGTDIAGGGPVAETFFVNSGGPFVLEGEINAVGGIDGTGGEFSVTAGPPGNRADVTFSGPVNLAPRGDFGIFGLLEIFGAVVTLDDSIDIAAGSLGDAGSVEAHATESLVLTANGSIDVGAGIDGTGGEVTLTSDGPLSILGPVNADAGDSGGIVTLSGAESLEIAAQIRVDGNEINAGSVMAQSDGPLTVSASLIADSNASDGGFVTLDGCIVTVDPGVLVDVSGATCSNGVGFPACEVLVTSRTAMSLAGQFTVGVGGLVELTYRDPANPPILTALFDVVPVQILDPTLASCGPDSDLDGVDDVVDNCVAVPNASQLDTDLDGAGDACDNCLLAANGPLLTDAGGNVQLDEDADGFGNICDCDFDGDGFCTIGDFNLFLPDFTTGVSATPGTDMDGDGFVTIGDFNRFLPGFTSGLPGPSAAP